MGLVSYIGWETAFDPNYVFTRRGRFMNGLDHTSRFVISAGVASLCSCMTLISLTMAFRRSVGRVSEEGITVVRFFREVHIPWAELVKAQFTNMHLHLTATPAPSAKAKVTVMFSTSSNQQDVLDILARYRPDLFPVTEPTELIEPNKPVSVAPIPQEQIVINSRQWTG
jgi:hypothetical protein